MFHSRFRELLVHTMSRHGIICPTYCVMPDHIHLLLMGLRDTSDQMKAVSFLRREAGVLLGPCRFQKQAFDHVLREKDRQRNAFQHVAYYILENPVRSGAVASAEEYPFSGAAVAGYPRLDPRSREYWPVFWSIYEKLVET